MQELEQLIRKFWANEISQEENHRLLQLLRENKDTYRDKIKGDFKAEEMDGTEALKAAGLLTKIHRNLGIESLEEKQQARIHSITRRRRYLAVAASVCAIALSIFLLAPHHRQATVVKIEEVKSPLPHLEHLTSGRDSGFTYTLEDGSVIQLKKKSQLSFYRPFRDGRRDLWLEGAAVFNVANDKSRPFTVYAGEVTTRVLGTRFSVNSLEAGKVKVRLLEGKIVVNSNPMPGPGMKDVYLTPGQELSFDKNSRAYTVNIIGTRPEKPARPEGMDNQPEMVFHKEPLGRVFQKIGLQYKIPLSYRKEELDGLYFTGTFIKSDDLHIVLSAICNVNNLAFTEDKDSIIITRSH